MINITKLISYTDYNSFSGCDVVVSAQMAPVTTAAGETVHMDTHVLGSLQTISYSTHQDRAPVRAIGNINAIDYVQGQRTIAGTMVFAMFHEHWMTPLLRELESKNIVSNADIWSDELPALNLTISMANEYGYKSNMVMYGVKFIEDGGVMSINDLYTENTLQYVATGIQPLKTSGQYDHSYTLKANKLKITNEYKDNSWTWSGIQTYTKDWKYRPDPVLPEGKPPYNPLDTTTKVDIIINQPISVDKDYIINISPVEKEKGSITNIYITKPITGERIDTTKNPITNVWTAIVPDGIYSVSYEDAYGNKVQNIDSFSTRDKVQFDKETNYPVISEIGSNSIKVLPNDIEHDYIAVFKVPVYDYEEEAEILYKIETNTSVNRSNSKEIVIEYLESDTDYGLYSFNSKVVSDVSEKIYFKTFASQIEKCNMLKEYIAVNKNLLINRDELIEYDYELLKYEYNNIIDAVLHNPDYDNDDVKTEMLFYATKLQNEFNSIYNDYGISNSINKNKILPLDNMFSINETVQSLIIYKRNNDKSYFVARSGAQNNYQYTGKHNTRYYIQSILTNNDKGNYVDFVCYSDVQKKMLYPYRNVNNLEKASFINSKTYVQKYASDFLIAIKAAENLEVYRDMLSMPYGKLENKILTVNVDYLINDDNMYYLCISCPEDALEYTPIRKIPFTAKDKELDIMPYYSGLLKNKYYLLWIQDRNFNNISEPFILSTYAEDQQVINYYNNKCMDYIKKIKNSFSTVSTYKYYLDNLYSELTAVDELRYKDLDLFILQTFMEMYGKTLNENLMGLLIMILDCIYITKNHFAAVANYHNSIITFDSSISCFVSAINITSDSMIKSIHAEYDINKYKDGITLLYATNVHSNAISGFVVIDNITKKIYTSNITIGGVNNGKLL